MISISRRMEGSLMLLVAAFIWGTTFVAQSVGMDYIGPFTFFASRCFLATAVLLPGAIRAGKKRRSTMTPEEYSASGSILLKGGALCGAVLCLGGGLQQIGLQSTSVGKSGFISALYIIIVPLLGLFSGRKLRKTVWAAVLLSLAGLYMLCITQAVSVEPGDMIILLSSVVYSVHILVVDRVSPHVDAIQLCCMQSFVAGLISLIPMFLFENPSIEGITACAFPIVYSGVLSSAVAYTLQIMGQVRCEPTVASLVMCLESVFAALGGWVVLHESLSPRELTGCVLVFAAILLAQLPAARKET